MMKFRQIQTMIYIHLNTMLKSKYENCVVMDLPDFLKNDNLWEPIALTEVRIAFFCELKAWLNYWSKETGLYCNSFANVAIVFLTS